MAMLNLEGASELSRSHVVLVLIILSLTLALGMVPYLHLYTALKWQWNAVDIGQFIFVIAVSRRYPPLPFFPNILISSIWMGVLLPIMLARGPQTTNGGVSYQVALIRLALAVYTVGYVAYYFADSQVLFYVIGFVDGFATIALPVTRGLISGITSEARQGVLFAMIALAQQMGAIIDPLLYGTVYRATLDFDPGINLGPVSYKPCRLCLFARRFLLPCWSLADLGA